MKYTVLQLVQKTLSAIKEATVNDIDDTVTARDIVDICEDVYFKLVADNDWPNLRTTRQLDSLVDLTRPNYLVIPENVVKINEFKYENTAVTDPSRKFNDLTYMDPRDFIEQQIGLDTNLADVDVVEDLGGINYFINNDAAPTCWTSFDDEHIATNSYDSAIENTLHAEKSLCWVEEIPSFTRENDFIPELPVRLFPSMLAEVKSKASWYIKQRESAIDQNDSKTSKYHQYGKSQVTHAKNRRVRWGRRRNL